MQSQTLDACLEFSVISVDNVKRSIPFPCP
jgi:hypothetical protein